jgi:hypothetical protein
MLNTCRLVFDYQEVMSKIIQKYIFMRLFFILILLSNTLLAQKQSQSERLKIYKHNLSILNLPQIENAESKFKLKSNGFYQFEFDSFGNVISRIGGQVNDIYEYDNFGRIKSSISKSNGNQSGYYLLYKFDTKNQLISISRDSLPNIITAYTYDNNGNEIMEKSIEQKSRKVFKYNALNKITEIETYRIDKLGKENLTGVIKYTYRSDSLIQSQTVYDISYDVLSLKFTINYSYDSKKQLIEERNEGSDKVVQTTKYLYNLSGLKIRITKNSVDLDNNDRITDFIYSNTNLLVQEKNVLMHGDKFIQEESIFYKYDQNRNLIEQIFKSRTKSDVPYNYASVPTSYTYKFIPNFLN